MFGLGNGGVIGFPKSCPNVVEALGLPPCGTICTSHAAAEPVGKPGPFEATIIWPGLFVTPVAPAPGYTSVASVTPLGNPHIPGDGVVDEPLEPLQALNANNAT